MIIENIKNQKRVSLSELSNSELLKLLLQFYDKKKYQEVIRIADRTNLRSLDQYWVHFLRGRSHLKLQNYDKAINDFNLSLLINRVSPACHLYLGMAFHNKKDFKNAETNYKLAISGQENYIEAMSNLGKLYSDFGLYKKAEEYLKKAIKINSEFPASYNFLGALSDAQNDYENAKKYYNKSILLDKSYHEPAYNLSLIQLNENNFKEGWKNFDNRWENIYYKKRKLRTNKPLWDVSLHKKCHITIWPEQGMGDFILFSRFLKDLKDTSKNFVVIVYDKLKPIFERSFPDIKFVTELNTDSIQYHAPIGDLAKFYINSFKDVKERSDSYLLVDQLRTNQIKKSLPSDTKICGISWISKNDSIGKNKSMTLEDMKDLLLLPGITFVDLQYTDTSEERAEFKNKYGVEIIKLEDIDNFNDIDGLASLINACDKVVSVSNTTVHIAGSIGKDTYLMLPKGKGRLWYWSKENEQNSIWYKSVQIIEQTESGSWKSVVNKIQNELQNKSSYYSKSSLENEIKTLIDFMKKGFYNKAIERCNLALLNFPESYEINNIIGTAYTKLNQYELSEKHFKRSIELYPRFYQSYYNLGYTYWKLEQLNLAEKYCLKALEINPNYAFAYNTLGNIYQDKMDYYKAIKNFEKSIKIDTNYEKPRYNLSILYLSKGKFKKAWMNFEHRWKSLNVQDEVKKISGQRWRVNLSKSVTIWPEQGVGDFILYSRFFRDVIRIADQIIVLIESKLKPIFERSFPDIKFVTELNTDSIQYHAPIGDLAKFYINSFKDVKERSDSYLLVDQLRTNQIKKSLPSDTKICGISWISKNDSIGKNKSMTLEDMKDLLLLPGITFVDLQYTDTSEERAEFKNKYGVEIIKLEDIDNFNDIDGLASLINACDKVVSVSNTTVHIAGSIGKDTYLMLPKGKGRLWYWSKENEQNSIWYKSVQIIEQTESGSWKSVVNKIQNELRGEI